MLMSCRVRLDFVLIHFIKIVFLASMSVSMISVVLLLMLMLFVVDDSVFSRAAYLPSLNLVGVDF